VTAPLRIGITSFASQGGSGVVATELGLALARRENYQIHFISHAQPPRLSTFTPNLFFHQVETSSYPPFPHAPYSLALASKMTEVAIYHELDILHVHYAIPHAASSYLAKQMLAPRSIATVTTLHGTDITLVGRDPSFFPLTKFSIEQSDTVTAVSEFLAHETREVFEIDRPIQVIPNFVDTAVFLPRPDLRSSNPLKRDGEPILLHASNLRPVKNIPGLIRTFAKVRERHRARLVVVGEGPERRPAEALARELGICDDILFLGNQDSMPELVAMADVVLLPSEHESFGLVALEAMSCATPVVATRRGGVPEVVEDGRHGFLHDPHDIEGMAGSVLEILENRALALQLGEQARATAREKFCIRCIIEDYVELYEGEANRVRRAKG
jgi:N-acetyl-alpha-D-glucosaminyl L-malate synthase BshA